MFFWFARHFWQRYFLAFFTRKKSTCRIGRERKTIILFRLSQSYKKKGGGSIFLVLASLACARPLSTQIAVMPVVGDNQGCSCRVKRSVVTLVVMSAILITGGIMNALGGSLISYTMKAFPSWLLYGTTLIYVLFFLILALVLREHPFSKANLTWKRQKHYIILGLLTAANGVLFQFSAFWVDGGLSQVLMNLVPIQVAFFAIVFLRERHYNKGQFFGMFIVLVGIVLGCMHVFLAPESDGPPSEGSDAWYWILVFIASTTFAALEQIWQQVVFQGVPALRLKSVDGIQKCTCLFWYNLYSLPIYLLTFPLEMVPIVNGTDESHSFVYVLENQGWAFECFLGKSADSLGPGYCVTGFATLWVLVFCLGYFIDFVANIYLVDRIGALHSNTIGIFPQLVAIPLFSLPMGQDVKPFTWWPIYGSIAVLVGMVIDGYCAPNKEFGNRAVANLPPLDVEKDMDNEEGLLLSGDANTYSSSASNPSINSYVTQARV